MYFRRNQLKLMRNVVHRSKIKYRNFEYIIVFMQQLKKSVSIFHTIYLQSILKHLFLNFNIFALSSNLYFA